MNAESVLGATNRPDLLDPALLRPGRFDVQVEFPLPDQLARQKIFQVHLRGRPVASDVTVEWLAEQTEGFGGADIEAVCRRTMMAALAARIEARGEKPEIDGIQIRREHLLPSNRRYWPTGLRESPWRMSATISMP